MKCSLCEKDATTNGVLAFTKPIKSQAGKIPEDASGEYCKPHCDELFKLYAIIYRPADISRAEARKP